MARRLFACTLFINDNRLKKTDTGSNIPCRVPGFPDASTSRENPCPVQWLKRLKELVELPCLEELVQPVADAAKREGGYRSNDAPRMMKEKQKSHPWDCRKVPRHGNVTLPHDRI